jgi:tRNA (mo5U34)-methyltransferase
MNEQRVRKEIQHLAPWFHNIHLSDTIQTLPNHHFGDFPRWKWQQLGPHLPADLRNWTVLDIGCNAGFTASNWRGGAQKSSVSMPVRIILPKLVGRPPF